MPDVGRQDLFEVAAVDDQQPVEALGTDNADETLRDRVRLRRLRRRLDDLDAFAGEDGVEVACELPVAVTDQEAKRRRTLLQRPRELARLLGDPGAGRIGRAAGHVARRLPSSMKKSTYNRCSETVSTVKKSTASMLAACARRNARQERPERSPAGPSPAWRSSLRTVVAETSIPSPRSSPTMR